MLLLGDAIEIISNIYTLTSDVSKNGSIIIDVPNVTSFYCGFKYHIDGSGGRLITKIGDISNNIIIDISHSNLNSNLIIKYNDIIVKDVSLNSMFYDISDVPLDIKLLDGLLNVIINNIDISANILVSEYQNNTFTIQGITDSSQNTIHLIKDIFFDPINVLEDDIFLKRGIYANRYFNVNYDDILNKPWMNIGFDDVYFGGGNVGIGTYVPLSGLDLWGNASIKGNLDISGHILPALNEVYDLGSNDYRWRDIYLSGNTIDLNGTKLSKHTNGNLMVHDTSGTMLGVTMDHIDLSGTIIRRHTDGSVVLDNGSGGRVTGRFGDLDVSGNLDVLGNISGVNITGTRLISNIASGTAPLTVTSSTLVSNLNADLLEGLNPSQFMRSDTNTSSMGTISSSSTITGTRLISNIASGTAPFSVTSSTLVSNLNADLLDSLDSTYYLNYNNLSNKPTIPAAQVNADWNATTGVAQILNKPTISNSQWTTSGSTISYTGSTTISSATDTILTVQTTNDANKAEVAIYGSSQGTGRVYVGQSASYGGGIEYNGDNLPATTGAGADYITLFRRDNNVDNWTARNIFNTNDWEFRGSLTSNEVYTNNWFRINGNGGLVFQAYGYGLWSVTAQGSDYGNICTYGSGRSGWEGYSIAGRYVFMSDSNNNWGIFNDIDNRWCIYGNRNYVGLRYDGNDKIYTQDWGVYVNGQLRAHSIFPMASYNNNYITQYVDNIGFYNMNGYCNGYIENDQGAWVGNIDFTGQHRVVSTCQFNSLHEGLIVISIGTYTNFDTNTKPTINEALPDVELSTIANDKRVFGVISAKEDDNNEYRHYTTGSYMSLAKKTDLINRLIINSLGEGGLWICNCNGNIDNGDYITSSNIPGYGMKQNESTLINYTVAKITMSCDFNPQKVPKLQTRKQKVTKSITKDSYITVIDDKVIFNSEIQRYVKTKVESTKLEEEKVDLYDESGNLIGKHTINKKIIVTEEFEENILDNQGNLQWDPITDLSGNIVYEEEYDIRYLLKDGTIITKEIYEEKILNGEVVYKAAFVGCTYHCG